MAMNANVVLTLDMRRVRRDGTYPLILRLSHDGLTLPIPLGYKITETDWDEEERKVRKSYQGTETVTRLNNLLQKKKTNALDILMKLEERGELKAMSITDVKQRLVGKTHSQSFFAYAEKYIAALKKANRFGTANSYQDVVNVVSGFVNRKELKFGAISYDFLKRFEAHHLSKKGNTLNGLAVYMRTIRAFYNAAIKEGIAEQELYPFKAYKIKTTDTKKRALDIEFLNKIIDLHLEPEDILFDARNYFVASYMMYGMNFMDLAFLQKADVIQGRVDYRRSKTSKHYDIALFPALQAILEHYSQSNPRSKYVFPVLEDEDLEIQTHKVKWARKRYNAKLKLLANKCDIESRLTSYVSRHSFATQALLHSVPITAISAMLGHSSVKTTEIYLKGLPSNVLDAYNSQIMMPQPKPNG